MALPSLSSSRRSQRRSVHPGLSPSIVASHARFCRKSKSPQKRHQSVAPMLLGVHCCQPAPDHSQQACRIHTWQAMGKEKSTPWQASSHRLRTPPWGRFRPWRFDMGYGGLHFSVVKTGLTSETGFVSCEKKPANKCGHVDNTNHQQIQRQEQIPEERNSN